jgi:hypothetical protein
MMKEETIMTYPAHGYHLEGEILTSLEKHDGKFPDLQLLWDAGKPKAGELWREIGRRCFPGNSLEEVMGEGIWGSRGSPWD